MNEERADVLIYICKNETGEIRTFEDWLPADEDGAPDCFIWEYGNYACDCNRHEFFRRAGNESDTDHPCSDTAYSVKIMWGDKCVYTELER